MTNSANLARLAQTQPTGDYAQIGNNGVALLKAGYYPAAELYLTRAIEMNPGLFQLYSDLALAFSFNNKPYHALTVGFEALKQLPDQFLNFSWILQQIPVTQYNPLYRQILEYLLSKNLYSDSITGIFYQILLRDPRYLECTNPDPQTALATIDDVMCNTLSVAPVTEPIIEEFLTKLRNYLAENPATNYAHDPYKNIRAALIAQGLLNEYSWLTPQALPTTPLERFMFEDISIHDLPAAKAVLEQIDYAPARKIIADHLAFREQLPTLIESTPAFSEIENETSKLVRAQYEQNPYPRWTQAARQKNDSALHPIPVVNQILQNANNVLIAGCGTGQQILFANDTYAKANITAFDLSRASMAYAKYRLNTLGVKLPQMYHGDILKAGELNRTFDVIECSGVLHHMKDPLAGLDTLLSILEPGGYMHLGLYSTLARTEIAKARHQINARQYPATIDGIRTCRRAVMTEEEMFSSFLIHSRDFYITSPCRDLIFHVQEHTYTIPELKKMIQDRHLEFLGFEILNPSTMAHFYEINGQNADILNLDNWEKLEQAYPKTFRAMYNFWLRKPTTH